ncbi:MAG: porin family protein [Caulobacterales bacterium]|jgi:outer membrane immunogenic protein|nr:porin family protein [Caulobacterales bacterium]
MQGKILTVGAALAMSTTPAFAEGFNLNFGGEPGDWSGPFVGASLQYVESEGESEYSGRDLGQDWNHLSGGVEAGFNIQRGPMVFGVDGQVAYAGQRSRSTSFYVADMGYDGTDSVESELEWFGTARARLGYAASPNLMVYGAGGIAFGQVNTTAINDVGYDSDFIVYEAEGREERTELGWTVGVGGQWAVNDRWSVTAEASHINLDDSQTHMTTTYSDFGWGTPGDDVGEVTSKNDVNIFRVGVAYRL